MANVMRTRQNYLPLRHYPVKGSAEAFEVGDLLYLDDQFQGNTAQDTVRPASSGSADAGATTGEELFATRFAGVAHQRHDLNSFDQTRAVSVEGEFEFVMANSTGVDTAATADIVPGTKVAVATTSTGVPLDDRVVVEGHGGVTSIPDAATIGRTSRVIKNGDTGVLVHLKSVHVMSNTGV
jgi:hypothetical protein